MANEKSGTTASDEYRPSRKSFAVNYVLAATLVFVLFTLSLGMDAKDPASFLVFIFVLIFLSMLVAEPEKTIQENAYAITENEIIHTFGIFSKRQTIMPFGKIESIKVEQSVLGRMLDFGDIHVSGTKDTIVMKGLCDADDVYRTIGDMMSSSPKSAKQ